MKKAFCLLLTLFLLLSAAVPVRASAASPRMVSILPTMTFRGTTAQLGVEVNADSAKDTISAVIILWENNKALDQWSASGTGFLDFVESYSVSKGHTYVLTADVTINGKLKPRVSITRTCE